MFNNQNSPQVTVIKENITLLLKQIIDPRADQDLISVGFVQDVNVSKQKSGHALAIITCAPMGKAPTSAESALMDEIKVKLANIEGLEKVTVLATAHAPAGASPASQQPRVSGHANPLGVPGKRAPSPKITLPQIKHIILVASGKGGVGKSTIAANLAISLAKNKGLKVGLMDADIYGPSLPVLFGLSGRPPMKENKIQTINKFGIELMSIGLLLDESKSLAWRGPMVMGAVQQLLTDVAWPPLDVLVIDTPPGTGDAHLTLLQKVDIDGAIIVSTPQQMALADVRRGVELFRKMDIPLLGLIENMAWLELPDGTKAKLFGEGGAEQAAKALGVGFLGAIPMIPDIAAGSDRGMPDQISKPDSTGSRHFETLADKIGSKLALYPAPEGA